MKVLKKTLLSISGTAYGFLSVPWAILSYAFVVPDCTPDSYDWDEYTGVSLPLGIFSLLIFLTVAIGLVLAFRKKKDARKLFYIFTAAGAILSFALFIIEFRRY